MNHFVNYTKTNGTATITLKREETYNSLNTTMAFEFQQALYDADKDNEVRVVVITGSGKAFCAGQDLNEMIGSEAPSINRVLCENHDPIVRLIRGMKKPVVAAVNGVAAGAGAVFALACDLVIASESASFIQAFAKIGLTPGSGSTHFLPRLVGMQKAMAILLLGDKISAKEAERIGMIYRWVSDDCFADEVRNLAIQLASAPSKSMMLTKMALSKCWTNSMDEQIELEKEYKCLAGESEDYYEGVAAFLSKRKPKFNTRSVPSPSVTGIDIKQVALPSKDLLMTQ